MEFNTNAFQYQKRAAPDAGTPACPVCADGTPAKAITSRSEKNPGREFWGCSKTRHDGFMGFCDEGPPKGGAKRARTGGNDAEIAELKNEVAELKRRVAPLELFMQSQR